MLTWVEVNTKALNHNLSVFRKLAGPHCLLMPVIKSNAYGHEIGLMGTFLDAHTAVDRMCVFSLGEALFLRSQGVTKPILVLGAYELNSKDLSAAITQHIILPVYRLDQAKAINATAKALHQKATVHLKIDIGTSRLGILPSTLTDFIKHIKKLPHLFIEGLFGHYASSEDDAYTTKKQQAIFEECRLLLEKAGFCDILAHTTCTAATILHPSTHYNAVRFGLGVYGLDASLKTRLCAKLKPALSWYTTIIQLKTVPTGTRISYGGTYTVKKPTKIATIPVGYWDGYDRAAFGNKAYVLVRGKRCPVRGRICMNITMIDVSAVKNVQVGDTVALIGTQKNHSVTVDELAELAGTINYEIVTRINPLIPRKLV